jgi:DNA polymerase-4
MDSTDPHDFRYIFAHYTPPLPPSSCEALTEIALRLRERIDLNPGQRYRLVGIGLSNFGDREETALEPWLFP